MSQDSPRSECATLATALVAVAAALTLLVSLPCQAAGAARLSDSDLYDCVARSQDAADAKSAQFQASCVLPARHDREVARACAERANDYCLGLLESLTVEDGGLARVSVNAKRAVFLRLDYRARLNGDPEAELLVLDRARHTVEVLRTVADGCTAGAGRLHIIQSGPLGTVASTQPWATWNADGASSDDEVARAMCARLPH